MFAFMILISALRDTAIMGYKGFKRFQPRFGWLASSRRAPGENKEAASISFRWLPADLIGKAGATFSAFDRRLFTIIMTASRLIFPPPFSILVVATRLACLLMLSPSYIADADFDISISPYWRGHLFSQIFHFARASSLISMILPRLMLKMVSCCVAAQG